MTGLPDFSKKKSAENKWSLKKEALKSRQMTDSLRVLKSVIAFLLCGFLALQFRRIAFLRSCEFVILDVFVLLCSSRIC